MKAKTFLEDVSPAQVKKLNEMEKDDKKYRPIVKNIEPLLNEMAKGGK